MKDDTKRLTPIADFISRLNCNQLASPNFLVTNLMPHFNQENAYLKKVIAGSKHELGAPFF